MLTELGLDARPELWPDYFGHYRRVVWLAQSRDPALAAEAAAIGAMFGLPLQVIEVGTAGLERELELLVQRAHGRRADSRELMAGGQTASGSRRRGRRRRADGQCPDSQRR